MPSMRGAAPGAQIRDLVAFGIHVNLGLEMSWKSLHEKSQEDEHGVRTLRKQSRAILVITFDRRNVRVSLDGHPWQKVRCVKVSSEDGARVLVREDLVSLLRDRMGQYASEEENEARWGFC